jgi:hypothetical protein
LAFPEPSAPFPFNHVRTCLATTEEIESYNLKVDRILTGVVWKRTISGDPILETITRVSSWKEVGRSYWGRWGQVAKIDCHANGKTWQIPNVALNIPYAHLIVSRVRKRVWEYARNAVHVYVDSIITKDQIPTGNNIGDWRLERSYDGVIIRGPGQYGALNALTLERMAGYAKDSPARNTPIAAVL